MPHVCFSDSQVACWIKGINRDWKPFVQRRVEEIQRLVPARCWNHCPGKDNPADIPSRGLSPTELSLCKLWQDGPEWLRTGIERNQSLLDTDIPDECKVELKTANKDTLLHVLLTQQTGWIGHIVDSERYSTTCRLYRVTATILKFIQLLKRQVLSPKLAEEDVAKAEELWIRESQTNDHCGDVVEDCRMLTFLTLQYIPFFWMEDATTLLWCIKRFAARRGLPRRFISDNAKTFQSAAKFLKAVSDHPDTKKYLASTVGRRLLNLPDHLTYLEPVDDEDFGLNVDTLQRRTKHLNNVINHFWRRWSREYLLELRDTHRQRSSSGIKHAIVVGDVVVIHDEDNPRGFWKLAKVQRMEPLLFSNDPCNCSTPNSGPLTPPASGQEDDTAEQLRPSTPQEKAEPPRSRRKAALKARQLIKQSCIENLVDHESVVNWSEDVGN
eukprot:Em0016g456a